MLITNSKPDKEKLKRHLLNCDSLYPTPLSKRVNIDEYTKKLLVSARFIYCESNQIIIGCLAFYDADVVYISNISVLQEYQGRGLSQLMIQHLIRHVGSRKIKLEVETSNQRAIAFYRKQGFVEVEKIMGSIFLEKR